MSPPTKNPDVYVIDSLTHLVPKQPQESMSTEENQSSSSNANHKETSVNSDKRKSAQEEGTIITMQEKRQKTGRYAKLEDRHVMPCFEPLGECLHCRACSTPKKTKEIKFKSQFQNYRWNEQYNTKTHREKVVMLLSQPKLLDSWPPNENLKVTNPSTSTLIYLFCCSCFWYGDFSGCKKCKILHPDHKLLPLVQNHGRHEDLCIRFITKKMIGDKSSSS